MNMAVGNELGVNVWWTIPEVLVEGEQAQQALVQAGFESDDIRPATRRTAISRACYGMQDRRHKKNRRVTEKVSSETGKVVFGVLDREELGNGCVGFRQNTTVEFNTVTEELSVSGSKADMVRAAFEENIGKVNADDIRNFVLKIIRMSYGIRKRPSGGIYFIPAQFSSVVLQAREALDIMFGTEVPNAPRIYVERVIDGDEERQNVAASVAEDLISEINRELAAVERISRSAKALAGHKHQIEAVAEMARVYEELLGKQADQEDLVDALRDAADKVAVKMGEFVNKSPAPKAKAAKPKRQKASKPASSGVAVADAIVAVLGNAGKALTVADITEQAIGAGWVTNGKTPKNTVAATIYKLVKAGVKIEKPGKGIYKLVA